MAETDEVFVYALSTCPWCRKTKQWFDDSKIPYEWLDVDSLQGDEADDAAAKATSSAAAGAFP